MRVEKARVREYAGWCCGWVAGVRAEGVAGGWAVGGCFAVGVGFGGWKYRGVVICVG